MPDPIDKGGKGGIGPPRGYLVPDPQDFPRPDTKASSESSPGCIATEVAEQAKALFSHSLRGLHWAFSRGPDDVNSKGDDKTKPPHFSSDPLKTLMALGKTGIREPQDVERFIDALLELEASDLKKLEDKVAAGLRVASGIARQFRQAEIPVKLIDADETSYTVRTAEEFENRMASPAKTYGIYLSEGTSRFVVIHEMTHAISGDAFLKLVQEALPDEDLKALEWPGFPKVGDSLGKIFIKLAGSRSRDEAYAGLAEAYLSSFLSHLNVYEVSSAVAEVMDKVTEGEKEGQEKKEKKTADAHPHSLTGELYTALDEGLIGYVQSGSYLGDNHLFMYNLAALAELAVKIVQRPGRLQAEVYRSLPRSLRLHTLDFNPFAWRSRIQGVINEIVDFAADLHRDPKSTHPLKPVVERLFPLLRDYFGFDLGLEDTADASKISVGPRGLDRPAGDSVWIDSRPHSAREAINILAPFSDVTLSRIQQVVKEQDYEALAVAAMMIPDEDLPQFWSLVLNRVNDYQRAFQRWGSAEDAFYRLLMLPLVSQGYFDHASHLWPHVRSSHLEAEQWVALIFDGLDYLSRWGDDSGIHFWIDVLEDEMATGWTRRYHQAILETLRNFGQLQEEGKQRFQEFLASGEGQVISPFDVYGEIYELVTEGQYDAVLKTRLKEGFFDSERAFVDVVEDIFDGEKVKYKIEDPEDVEAYWLGVSELGDARREFAMAFPRFEHVRQLVDAAGRMQARGYVEQAGCLKTWGRELIQSIISRRMEEIKYRLERIYEHWKEPVRRKDTFLQHVAKLKISETRVLPPASAVAGELMIIADLPEEFGGGWDTVLNYLKRLPDCFVKTFACFRLSQEMNHVSAPTDAQLLSFLEIWDRSFTAAGSFLPSDVVQPDEEGMLFEKVQQRRLSAILVSRGSGSSFAARLAFEQQQRAAMYETVPEDAIGKLGQFRHRLYQELKSDGVSPVSRAARFVPTMYDPTQTIEEVTLTPGRHVRQVYTLLYDPNIIPLKIEAMRTVEGGDIEAVREVARRIEEAIENIPEHMQAHYIPVLISLSAAAAKLDEDVAADLYLGAQDIAERTRRVSSRQFSRQIAYLGLDKDQQAFDFQARFRRYQATWERTSLASLARLLVSSSSERQAHYAEDIRRIVDNESIFDMMESADYAEAAAILDAGGAISGLVKDLYQRAIQQRVREQFEASYDVDHELFVKIDASKTLALDERDGLLAEFVEVNFQRLYHYFSNGTMGAEERHRFLWEMRRFVQPYHLWLDLAEQRGYKQAERALWRGLRRASEVIVEQLPLGEQPLALTWPVLFTLTRHPELVHPDSKSRVIALSAGEENQQALERIFTSSFAHPDGLSYEELPTVRSIRSQEMDDLEIDTAMMARSILAHIPVDGRPIDPYLLDLLHASFIKETGGCGDDYSLDDAHPGMVVFSSFVVGKLLIGHFGVKDFRQLVVEHPDVVRRVFLRNPDRQAARAMLTGLMDMVSQSTVPLEVRADAFRALVRARAVSDYLQARFDYSSSSDALLKAFMDNLSHIWIFDPVNFEHSLELIHDVGEKEVHHPDWIIAPLFEPLLASERSAVLEALRAGPVDPYDFDSWDKVLGPHHFLLTLWCQRSGYIIKRYENDLVVFPDRLEGAAMLFGHLVDDYDNEVSSEDVLNIYLRNRAMVSYGSIRIPQSLARLNPRLRFVIADYISHVPRSTRMLLLNALYRAQEALGEDEVLSIFFELTGMEKLAQFLSLQKGIVPESYRKKLERFQEDLKPSTQKDVIDTLRIHDLAPHIDQDRLEFEHAGTVGELWQGRLMDGRQVAIKVLPWKKRRRNEESIRALKSLAEDLQLFRHDLFGGIDFIDLYERYKETLLAEMNYHQEAENLVRLAPTMDKAGIAYPIIHQELLRQDVMVMDYLDFQDISQIKSTKDKQSFMDMTGRWLAESIFDEGVFYEDFHPGNIKWLASPDGSFERPLVLDYGRIGNLTEKQRHALATFLWAVAMEDVPEASRSLVALMQPDHSINDRAIRGAVEKIVKGQEGKYSETVQALFALASKRGGSLEPNYLQFLKAVISWEGVMRSLDPEASFATYAGPVIYRIINSSGGNGGTSPTSPTSGSPSGSGAGHTSKSTSDSGQTTRYADVGGFAPEDSVPEWQEEDFTPLPASFYGEAFPGIGVTVGIGAAHNIGMGIQIFMGAPWIGATTPIVPGPVPLCP